MDREVRYCTTEDGVRIAYCTEGTGPPLVMCPARGESFSLTHLSPELELALQRLGRGRRIVRYDERGTGLSQRDISDRSHAAFVRDIAAVVDSAGIETCSLWASCLSGPRAIDYAAQYLPRIERLVLHGTTVNPGKVFEKGAATAYAALARINWKMWSRAFVEISCNRKYPDLIEGLAEMLYQSSTGDNAADTLLKGSEDADVTAAATTLTMPVLVMHGTEDFIVLPEHGYDLTALIPNVRLVSLTGGVSYFFLGDTDALFKALDEFLPTEPPKRGSAGERRGGAVQTILFTDLVAHTSMMQRLGDMRGRDVLREHERITRNVLHAHFGDEIKTMGDGFMATFSSVTTGMECAVALQRAFAERNASADEPLVIRVGLNAGEPIEEDGDLFGATVIMAARIASQAGAGEILIPEPVRHLLAGKDFLFADRGEFLPKGFEDSVRLFEVRWQD